MRTSYITYLLCNGTGMPAVSYCPTRRSSPSKKTRKIVQIIASRMPFAMLHAVPPRRPAPHLLQPTVTYSTLRHRQSKHTKLCPHPRSLPSNRVIIRRLSVSTSCAAHPFRSPLLPEVPCPPFYPLHEEHFNRTPCATDLLCIPMPCAVVATRRILLAALSSPAPRSHLNYTSACIHRSIPPPSRLVALEHVYIMTPTPFRIFAPLHPTSHLMVALGDRVDR